MLTNVDFGVRKKGLCAFWSVISVCFLTSFSVFSQHRLAQPKTLWQGDTSLVFRGISALSDDVIWASSNQDVVVKTEDGGINWTILKIPGAEGIQFRDIHLFNEKTALIMGSGWPTRIYKTSDAGLNWRLVYENNDSAVFLDGFDFWSDGSGLCFGDPVDGKFFLLKTDDEGEHWYEINGPRAIDGEAGFAASGTSLVCYGADQNSVRFGTGGKSTHIFTSSNRGESWMSVPSRLRCGEPSQGVFGMAHINGRFLFVGGDYLRPTSDSLTCLSMQIGRGICYAEQPQSFGCVGNGLPYQSAAVCIDDFRVIAVGTPGCYFSSDFGLTWVKFAEMPLHTITKARKGSALYGAGSKGRIVKFIVSD